MGNCSVAVVSAGVAASQSPRDRFVTVYGRMPVLEVLQDPGLEVDKVVVADGAGGGNLARIVTLARELGVPVQRAGAQRVKLLAGNGRHDQGVIADVVAPRMSSLEARLETGPAGERGVLVLDGVTNPSNLGMILRTATAAGVDGVVVPTRGSAALDPLVVKASAGVAFRAPILRSRTSVDAVQLLREKGYRILGLAGDARTPLFDEAFPPSCAFVLGNETAGVSAGLRPLVDSWVGIPLEGGVESLNVASAAAVLCFELVRRAQPPRKRSS